MVKKRKKEIKKKIASKKFEREASWQETVMLYKGHKSLSHPQMQKILNLYNELKK